MSDQCGYWEDGQYEVRGLRQDVDNLLAELERTRAELATLKLYVTRLRDRVDAGEMAGAR